MVVMFGTAVGQVVGLACMPVISRLFSPADFGVFGSFSAVLGMVGAGVTLQFSQALMLPKEEGEAARLLILSSLASFGIAVFCVLASAFFPGTVLKWFKTPGRVYLLWLLPLAVLVNGLNQSIQGWCVRRKKYNRSAGSQIARSLSASGAQILTGYAHSGSSGLVCGSIIGDTMASASLCLSFSREELSLFRTSWDYKQLCDTVRKFIDFPVYATPQNVLNAVSQGIPVLLLAKFFGIAVAGSYAVAFRILQAPMNLILIALRQVLFQRLTESHNNGQNLFPIFVKMTVGLFFLVIIPSGIGFVWAPELFVSILGKEWGEAGIYARWLILWLAVGFLNVPSMLLGRILRQQRNLLLYDTGLLTARVATLVVGGICFDPLKTVIMFSIVGAFFNILIIFWVGNRVFLVDKSSERL